ncbi:MAG: hypothetical protein ACK5B9_00105, partial [Flavobacteriia bacterium]
IGYYIILGFLMSSCNSNSQETLFSNGQKTINKDSVENKILNFQKLHQDSINKSVSNGTVGNGSLQNGKLFPFEGKNFFYFDTSSYLAGRAFLNGKVKDLMLETYQVLEKKIPQRNFGVMECSHEDGGKLSPHITHQNGLSVDFMTPLMSKDSIFGNLDKIGLQHYFLDFNSDGKYLKDNSVQIDFDALALHILTLNELSSSKGLKIEKILFKIELLDNLFASKFGKKLKESGIYFAKKLSPQINALHDDHYHIDFSLR